ncbi:MAG: FAD-binding oxidoreductase [Nocardioidaceae bacterium]
MTFTQHHAGAATREWVVRELFSLLGERLVTSEAVREQHGHDESYHEGHPPDAVAFVESTDEVSEVLSVCHAARMPVVPFGVGTSLEGGVCAVSGGVCLDLSGMNRVLDISEPDLDATVQAGVTHGQLNAVVRPRGVFFSVDPGADATIGGMCATRASGTTAVGYGTMRANVLGLTAVLANGTVIRTGGHARKSAAGYDLTGLLIGSEGTLGVITEVIVRLHPTPDTIRAATCSFPDLERAVDSVIAVLQCGVVPARIELLDDVMVEAVTAHTGLSMEPGPAVLYEFHGGAASVGEAVATVTEVVAEYGGHGLATAQDEKGRRDLWRARHAALPAAKAMRPGASTWSTDVCVPISRLAECLLETRKEIDRSGLLAPIAGHVGDGNFHLAIVLDPADEDEFATAVRLNEAMVGHALRLGGTCTGEHGIGLGKREHLAAEAGTAVDSMREVKRALDPLGILNPGKLF